MAERHLVIGTAGHVDHGKTALIRALTGTNTDRLREEQERGMSIELGFASFTLPSGVLAGIVDVPGHERFLKNMLAGAAGIDLVVLVVAADEGVMPQTVEHLDILGLLRTKAGLVALTKIDLVDEAWADLVEEDLRLRLRGTFLDGAPVIRVSSVTGAGLHELVAAMDETARAVAVRSPEGPFRMPVDRIFTMPGFGTVVAGTVWSGSVRVGDVLELQPTGIQTRVRGLQIHGRKVDMGTAGVRLAANLVGVDVADVPRGGVLAVPGAVAPSTLVDAELQLIPRLSAPLRHRTRIRLHTGTAEIIGRVALLDRDELQPGESAPVQFQLEEPVAALRGDRYIVRLYSPMVTLGGGELLDPHARRHKRHDERALKRLEVLRGGDLEAQVAQALLERELAPASAKEIAASLGGQPSAVEERLASLHTAGDAVVVGERYLHVDAVQAARQRAEAVLASYHREWPLRLGMSREELRTRTAPRADGKTWAFLLDEWRRQGVVRTTGNVVALASHRVAYTEDQQRVANALLELYRERRYDPPSRDDALAFAAGGDAALVLESLAEQGLLVRITEGLYLHAEAVQDAERVLRGLLKQGPVTVAQFRDAIGSSRKVVVPLLEHFDSVGVTRRLEDVRVPGPR